MPLDIQQILLFDCHNFKEFYHNLIKGEWISMKCMLNMFHYSVVVLKQFHQSLPFIFVNYKNLYFQSHTILMEEHNEYL